MCCLVYLCLVLNKTTAATTAGSGQSDGEASGGSGQSDGETAAAPSRMKKSLAADASGRGGAGMSVHTSDSDSDAGSPSNA